MSLYAKLLWILGKRPTALDNFEYIALNMALLRHCLRVDHSERFSSEEQLILTCGVLDTLVNIEQGHFAFDRVKYGLTNATLGQITLGLLTIATEDQFQTFYMGTKDLFLNFTMQIQDMVLWAGEMFIDSSGLSDRDVIQAVIDARPRTRRILAIPGHKLEKHQGFGTIRKLADACMNVPEFMDYRKAIGLCGA